MVVIVLAVAEPGIPGNFYAIPIGAIVGVNVMMFGPTHGAAMNPARAFGPYMVGGDWSHYWIYVLGPLAGLISGGFICRWVFGFPRPE